ncbi:GGDEF domain-containing protein [Phreatobacter stygius]|uniref:diguanylate cyclase n=1 Tax=Phreatobacter stygius TaxID=1940610 RepID=A0A4D7BIW0_9HYPH|nr:sensor domain-containing diguanylate cyclase [Phreatobacter stygius]QCI67752.1 GGDEF domain-containing protein [Phreatobacter stygius]
MLRSRWMANWANRGPALRWVAPIVLIAGCFCAVCAHVLIEARHAALERAAQTATGLVAAIETDTIHNVESVALSIAGVVEGLKRPYIDQVSPELRQVLLFDRSTTARHLGGIMVIDETGEVHLDSRTLYPLSVNLSDRDYFQFHKGSASAGIYISRPYEDPITGQLSAGVSRRLSHPDGSFAGVVIGALRLEYFQNLFKDTFLGTDGLITLARADGTMLMRWPFQEHLLSWNLRSTELFRHFAQKRAGRYEVKIVPDGIDRLMVYGQIGELPLVVVVGQSLADIYASWRRYASIVSLLVAGLCAVTVTLAVYLARELKRRTDTEAELELRARTDELTGLSNRRHFNETLDREWGRAARAQEPLALLMLDIDHFKTYNDAYGHQAGDKLLQALGSAIKGSIRRPGDHGARYGGDEFSILLPGTEAEGAVRVAELVRACLAQTEPGEIRSAQRLSVGVACLTPKPEWQPDELIALADRALYRAKELGRNRTEIVERRSARPALRRQQGPHQAS